MFDKYPYANFHEMNLDWIIQQMKDLIEEWENFNGRVTATAHESEQPEVNVDGSLQTGLSFDFGLVPGADGAPGAVGPVGPQGPQGSGLEILDVYPTLSDLQEAHPAGSSGDAYQVGTGGAYTLYIWSTSGNEWVSAGTLSSPSPSETLPSMDGTASAGSSLLYSKGDHVHPSDTSKLDKSNTDGIYAVSNGSQTMLNVSSDGSTDPGSVAAFNSNGDMVFNDIFGDTADFTEVNGDTVIAGSLSVTNNQILNSQRLNTVAVGNAYKLMATVNPIDPLILTSDTGSTVPKIKYTAVSFDADGTMNSLNPEISFTDSFNINNSQIDLTKASSSVLGGVKVGNGLQISSTGTLSFSFSDSINPNLNDMRSTFIGYIYEASNTPAGANTTGQLLSIFDSAGNRGQQIYFPYQTTTIYVRKYYASAWTNWMSITPAA